MIGAWLTLAIGFIALSLHGYWHGERRYRTGVRHGRRIEAMEARHARERIVEEAELLAIRAYIDVCDITGPTKGRP